MKLRELAVVVEKLAERVAALEAQPSRESATATADLAIVQSLLADVQGPDSGGPEHGTVVYAGAGPGPDGVVAWQMMRRWDEITGVEPAPAALVLAALGSPHRLQVLQLLIDGPATTAELGERLEGASSGRLFHHLKELLAAGLVSQPRRGTYAIPARYLVPIVTLVACALDLAGPVESDSGGA